MKRLVAEKVRKKGDSLGMNFRYARDEMCVNYDFATNSFSIFFNGEVFEGSTPKNFLSKLDEIAALLKPTKKENEIFICYAPNIKTLSAMLPEGTFKEHIKKGKKLYMTYRTDHFEFREFSMFSNDSDIKKYHAANMYALLKDLAELAGFDNICDIQKSAGWVTKKALSLGLEDEIKDWHYTNKNYRDSVEQFKEQLIGNKSGLLKAEEGIFEDVLMIDIKSAYLSALMHIQRFPIGRLVRSTGRNALINFLSGSWYHIIIKTEKELNSFFDNFRDDNDKNSYGFYLYDQDLLWDNGYNLKRFVYELVESGDAELICYDSSTYGPILSSVVDKIMYFYDMKQKTKAEGDEIRKDCYKIITELIYGKALQEHDFESNGACYRYFNGPENVIRPEYSMMAASYVRWRLSRMIKELGGSYYHDTDGIETAYSEEKEEIVERQNNLIVEYNKSLGHDSIIGTYDIEAKHAKIGIIARKQRFYIDDNGKLECRICGISRKYLEERTLEAGDESMFNRLTKSFWYAATLYVYLGDEIGYIPQMSEKATPQDIIDKVQTKKTLQGCCQEGS